MKQYIIDAFTDKVFSGNPAAVCVLDDWLSDDMMLNIAVENNLSETAFIVKNGSEYNLRWFTPTGEIDFCGHATLASAYTLFNHYNIEDDQIIFKTAIDTITVKHSGEYYEMTFPKYDYEKVNVTEDMINAFSVKPKEAYLSRDLLLIFDSEDYDKIKINHNYVEKLDATCVAISSKSSKYDCISRVFAPRMGIKEDPVTGSTHCLIAPYWAKQLNKNELIAYQDSKRGGTLYCKILKDKVQISGKAVLYSIAELNI
jgi:PhzF family phenazine biosynthesis protein